MSSRDPSMNDSTWQIQGPFDPETLFVPPGGIYTPLKHLEFIKTLLEEKAEIHSILGPLRDQAVQNYQTLAQTKTLPPNQSQFWGLNWSSVPYYPTSIPVEDYRQYANNPWQRQYRNLVKGARVED